MKLFSFLILFGLYCYVSSLNYESSPVIPAQYRIDLNSDPYTRWIDIVSNYKDKFGPILQFIDHVIPPDMQKYIDPILASLDQYLPYPYADELRGISNGTGIELGKVVLFNILYEATAFCTTIMCQRDDHILHVRNLDYSIDGLRNITIEVIFERNGREVYRATTFAGYVGVLTGMRPGAWSVTVNQRDTDGSILDNLQEALKGGKSIGMFLRQTLETEVTFENALQTIQHTLLTAPVYISISGVSNSQAAIVSRDREHPADVWQITPPVVWDIVQTNDDHWQPPQDDRRDAANAAMSKLSMKSVTLDDLMSVLSTSPVFNGDTIYTTLMCAANGNYTTFIRYDYPNNIVFNSITH